MSSKQESLFNDEQKRSRKVEKFVKSASKDGTLSVTIDAEIATRIRKYCRMKNLNCKKLVQQIISEKIDELEASRFDDMSREDLLELVKRMEAEKEAQA